MGKVCKNQDKVIKRITKLLVNAKGKVSIERVKFLLNLIPSSDEVVFKVCKRCKPNNCIRGKALLRLERKILRDLR